MSDGALLEVRDLEVEFATREGTVRAVDGVTLDLRAEEVTALVGESGCGKSAAALALLGLNRGPKARTAGSARFEGLDLIESGEAELRAVRGERIAMVFQDPMTSLNPVMRVGEQIVEGLRARRGLGAAEARGRAVELLEAVGVTEAARRVDSYPHELSGGQRQRAMIAMALALDPELLIADEPTTALDVTVQARILDLLRDLNRERGLAILLITHDIGVVAELADRVAVMYAGEIVEQGGVEEVFATPRHPYTWGLLGSATPIDGPRLRRLPQISGAPPSPLEPPTGCRFAPRCPHRFGRCDEHPPLAGAAHLDRCWLGDEEKRRFGSEVNR